MHVPGVPAEEEYPGPGLQGSARFFQSFEGRRQKLQSSGSYGMSMEQLEEPNELFLEA